MIDQDNGDASGPGCQPSASDASASSRSGIPIATLSDFLEPMPNAPGLQRITDLSGFLDTLGKQLAPVFAEQKEAWKKGAPAAMAAFEATGAALDSIGGNCPVQAEGDVDGQRFYFRARYDEWQFHVAPSDDAIFADPTFYIERDYGGGFDAGWMPKHEALGFIVASIAEYRSASAIEARRAETGTGSVADESAVGNAETPQP